jgi:hypothetical protein
VEAYKWWGLATAQGIEEAKEGLQILANRMTPEQIVEGEKLSADWKGKR